MRTITILASVLFLSLTSCQKNDLNNAQNGNYNERHSNYSDNINNNIRESVVTCTPTIYGVHSTDVTLFGKVTNDGGNHLLQRGLCYKLINIFNPTTSTIFDINILSNTTGIGLYSENITLTPGWYATRAYVINAFGTITYGNTIFFEIVYLNN